MDQVAHAACMMPGLKAAAGSGKQKIGSPLRVSPNFQLARFASPRLPRLLVARHQAARSDLNHNHERKHTMNGVTLYTITENKLREHRYPVIRSTDGCDETYEVYSAADKSRIAWVGFWDERPEHKRNVRKVAAFLEAVANEHIQLDLGALIEELKAIAAPWGWNELSQARPDLSDGDIWDVLSNYRYFIPHGKERTFPDDLIAEANRFFPPKAAT
jgi:hypothetical protein